MSQVAVVIAVLKQALRQRGLVYADVGRGLGLSESSVKRMFAQQNLSLDRLEQICALMNLEIADLLELTRDAEARITELTEEQERELVGDPKLLLVAIVAISHWTASKILETYQLSESELVKILARLDRMRIIDLLPDNRIKVRLARNFTWRKAGPIQRFFEKQVQAQFFESSFLEARELRITVHGSLSGRSIEVLHQRMRKIAEEFDSLVGEDRQLDYEMRDGTTMVLAIRPWELSLFTELRHGAKSGNPPALRAKDRK
jgi:DNA-binding Xre family transcriptional regulator